jgi:hypothetical protein
MLESSSADARIASYTWSSASKVVSISTRARSSAVAGVACARCLDRFGAVAGLANDHDVVLHLEDHPEPRAHELLVVCNQDPNHVRVVSSGSLAATW